MSPAAAVASQACAHLGAVQVPIFSGFAAAAVVQRLQDSGAKVVITADWSYRRGTRVPMRETIDEALLEAPSVEHVVEWRREDGGWSVPLGAGALPPVEVDGRASVPARVHLRHDRAAEGRPARPGRLPPLDRARGRVPVRHPRRRPHAVRDRHGLDHGPVDGCRRGCARSGRRIHGGSARLARRPALAPRRGRGRDDARPVPHARAGPDPEGRARGGSLVAPRDHDDGRALERRARTTG